MQVIITLYKQIEAPGSRHRPAFGPYKPGPPREQTASPDFPSAVLTLGALPPVETSTSIVLAHSISAAGRGVPAPGAGERAARPQHQDGAAREMQREADFPAVLRLEQEQEHLQDL